MLHYHTLRIRHDGNSRVISLIQSPYFTRAINSYEPIDNVDSAIWGGHPTPTGHDYGIYCVHTIWTSYEIDGHSSGATEYSHGFALWLFYFIVDT